LFRPLHATSLRPQHQSCRPLTSFSRPIPRYTLLWYLRLSDPSYLMWT
jgi:hypothetical protein